MAGVKTLQLAHRVNKVQIRSAVELLAPGRSRNDDGKQIHGLYDADGVSIVFFGLSVCACCNG